MRKNYTFFLLLLLLSGCSTHLPAPITERNITLTPRQHKVHKGETVYSIAWMYGLDYRSLARWNRIVRPYPIYPGQLLSLKPGRRSAMHTGKALRRAKRTTAKRKPVKKKTVRKVYSKNRQSKTGKKVVRKKVQYKPRKWVWPTKGKVFRTFSRRDSGKKGIAISGRMGQSILASASGRVVYSGEGLLRYGKLIIIKHNATYLSAYAHNSRLLVKEGQRVRQWQKIAEMGRSGTDRPMLHFEIRKNGKPVNPLYFLPKR